MEYAWIPLSIIALTILVLGTLFALFAPARRQNSPECDRCGKPTGKPWLYRSPRTPWRCDPCEREAIDILFNPTRR